MNNSPYLLPIIVAGCFYAFGQYVSSEPARNQDQVLTVQATGSAKSVPDIAHVTLGVQIQPQATAPQATDMLAKQTSAVVAAIKKLGIEEKDIKTQNISVQPSYSYDEGKQTLRGFEASEQIEVIIRKTDQAGDVIARGAQAGANQIGGVTFSNEDLQNEQLASEKDAIEHARKKATALADALHVRLGKVKNYSVSQNYGGPVPYAMEAKAIGGDSVSSPPILPGTQENAVTVTVTYEIQ